MNLQDKLRQVRGEICTNRRSIQYTRLEAIAGTGNPYSLIQMFGKGHLVTRSGATAVVTKCSPVDVMIRSNSNCTEEIPVVWKSENYFVDPINFVLKISGSPVRCNDIAPPRWLIANKWYCAYPIIKECVGPKELPVEEVKIEDESLLGMGLGRSIYSKEQLVQFAHFQDAAGTREAYLAESAQIAYAGRSTDGNWGLSLNNFATSQLMNMVGLSFIPLYWILGPLTITVLFAMSAVGAFKLIVTICIRAITIARTKGCGPWIIAAFYGTLFQVLMLPFDAAIHAADRIGRRVGDAMDAEATTNHQMYPSLDEKNELREVVAQQ